MEDLKAETHTSSTHALSMNNEGGVYVRNRAARRQRPPSDPFYTKATHKFKKLRSKNAKRNNKRELKRIREARKESDTQVS